MGVKISIDQKRGCGWRKEGGKYFIGGFSQAVTACLRLPIRLDLCPTCNQGIKPSRGFQWINPLELIAGSSRESILYNNCEKCNGFGSTTEKDYCIGCEGLGHIGVISNCAKGKCLGCPVGGAIPQKAGLLWIGGKYYKTPEDFLKEAATQGISRRIAQVPKEFIVGKHWIYLAHREAIYDGMDVFEDKQFTPAIFYAFKPAFIEYIVTGKEDQKELERLEKRGLTLITIKKNG